MKPNYTQLEVAPGDKESPIVKWYPDLGSIEVSGYYDYGCWSLGEFFDLLRITPDDCVAAFGESDDE